MNLTAEQLACITKFALPVYPASWGLHDQDYITVEQGAKDRWAVCYHGSCYDRNGESCYEPSPSNRDAAFIAEYRFDFPTAWALAQRVVVNRRREMHPLLEKQLGRTLPPE